MTYFYPCAIFSLLCFLTVIIPFTLATERIFNLTVDRSGVNQTDGHCEEYPDRDVPEVDMLQTTLVYAKLLDLDPLRQQFTMIMEYSMNWRDERLIWNKSDFGNIDHLYVRRSSVWVPDMCSFDSINNVDVRPDYKQFVTVLDFPFDIQECSIRLLSYTFLGEEQSIEGFIYDNLYHFQIGNEEWEVISVNLTNATTFNKMAALDIINIPLIGFKFTLKRNPMFYIALMIIPSFGLTFLCIAGMFSTPICSHDSDKVNMGLTTIMSSTVMISIVADTIPKTKEIPHLTSFVTFNMCIVAMALMVILVMPKIALVLTKITRCLCRCKEKRKYIKKKTVAVIVTALILSVFEILTVSNLLFFMDSRWRSMDSPYTSKIHRDTAYFK